jgi:hypothetical protein
MPSFIATGNTGGGGRIEPGIYKFEVVEAVEKLSTSGNEMIVLKLETEGGDVIQDQLVFTTKAYWKIESFLVAAGKKKPEKGQNINLSTRDCLEFEVWAKIRPQKDNPEYNEVDRYLTHEEALKLRSKPPKTTSQPVDDFDEIPF